MQSLFRLAKSQIYGVDGALRLKWAGVASVIPEDLRQVELQGRV
jgi:hypothetical protein